MNLPTEAIVYTDPPRGLPEARGWEKRGGGSVVVSGTDYLLTDASGTDRLVYFRPLAPTDTRSSRPRTADRVELQIPLQGVSFTAWGSVSPVGFVLDDGSAALAVSVGTALCFVNPSTGALIRTIVPSWGWNRRSVFRFVKDGTARWMLWADGRLLAEVPYGIAAASPGRPSATGFRVPGGPVAWWGSLSTAASAVIRVGYVEMGLNVPLPPQWKIDRLRDTMPIAAVNRWTDLSTALARATVGLFERITATLDDAGPSQGPARYVQEEATFSGAVLPSAEDPAWSLVGGSFSLVRERVRVTHAGLAKAAIRYAFTGTDSAPVRRVRATLTIRSTTPDGFTRLGPYLQMSDGTKEITAQIGLFSGAGDYAWTLSSSVTTGAPIAAVGNPWRVDPFASHVVELWSNGVAVLLILDGRIVERALYSSFPASANNRAEVGADIGPVCVFDVEQGKATRETADLSRRPLFLQRAIEALIPIGGCEHNDELNEWVRRAPEVMTLRGSDRGILLELRRLTCSYLPVLQKTTAPGSWYLERSYPEVTPIWLEYEGEVVDAFAESPKPANMTLSQFAEWVITYLLPMSTRDLEYRICLAAILTGPSSVPGAGLTRLPVPTTDGFSVGDAVEVRNAAATVIEETTIEALPSATAIDVSTVTPKIAGDTIRKILARS